MKRTLWILIAGLLVLTSLDMSAQRWKLRRYEADMYLGAVAFHGDIGLADRPLANMFNGMRPTFGVTPRFFIQENMAVSLDLAYLIYGGRDEEGSSHTRMYSFNSHAFQHMARYEYYIIGPKPKGVGIYNRRGMVHQYNKLLLYAFGGFGGILSKSTIKDLNMGGEEPIDNPGYYSGAQYTLGFPIGVAAKFNLDPRWSIAGDIGYMFTLSDKLDGYAPAASQYKDSYYLVTVKAVYRIRNDRNNRPIFNKYYR